MRIALLDDHRLLLDSLAFRFDHDPSIRVVGMAETTEEARSIVSEQQPDILILDLTLSTGGTLELCDEINREQSSTKICFLTSNLVNIFIEQALRLEVHGYLLKQESLEKLLEAIHRIHQGEQVFSNEVQQRLKFNRQSRKFTVDAPHNLKKLTTRQIEVLRQLARGKSVKEVAKDLHLSTKSIDSHKYRIMHKLG
ncbi:MAG: DNA-binding response regulator, partial [Planctomyces sp.]|nr:DNA-binding response regulator [Planctomyces sp.]